MTNNNIENYLDLSVQIQDLQIQLNDLKIACETVKQNIIDDVIAIAAPDELYVLRAIYVGVDQSYLVTVLDENGENILDIESIATLYS